MKRENKLETEIDWFSYVKLFFGLLMIFPLEWAGWSLDYGTNSGLYIAITIHLILFMFSIVTFNYLETDNCFRAARNLKRDEINKLIDSL